MNITAFPFSLQRRMGKHYKLGNSSSSTGTVAWLYSPCAASILARSPFSPEDFFSLALLFWNHILICVSLSPRSAASVFLRSSLR